MESDAIRSIRAPRPAPRDPHSVMGAVWIVLGGVAALFMGSSTLSLVREQLHISCGIGTPGSEGDGTWMCADGVGYFGVLVTLGGMAVLVALVGALVAALVRSSLAARVVLTLLAGVAVAWTLGWTWFGSSNLVWAVPPGVQSLDYWVGAVSSAATIAAVALLVALAALGSTGMAGRALGWVALAGLLVATTLQPGLGIATLAAAGLIGGALSRTP